jgi:hypothetical protein
MSIRTFEMKNILPAELRFYTTLNSQSHFNLLTFTCQFRIFHLLFSE